jgi:hypothetical protein
VVAALTERLSRRMDFSLSVSDRELYLSIGTDTRSGAIQHLTM